MGTASSAVHVCWCSSIVARLRRSAAHFLFFTVGNIQIDPETIRADFQLLIFQRVAISGCRNASATSRSHNSSRHPSGRASENTLTSVIRAENAGTVCRGSRAVALRCSAPDPACSLSSPRQIASRELFSQALFQEILRISTSLSEIAHTRSAAASAFDSWRVHRPDSVVQRRCKTHP